MPSPSSSIIYVRGEPWIGDPVTEPISIMLPFDNRPKTVTISVELSDAYVALLRAAEIIVQESFQLGSKTPINTRLLDAHQQVLRAGGGKS